jgi:DNA processing protein
VVGSRKCTPYGAKIIDQTIPPLIFAGVTIVSGLALGIDALAHIATLKSGGRTIGVLGCGLDERSFYPAQNRLLRRQIIEQGGLILSEYPPRTQPLKPNFPRRNRIIAGLSLGTFVVEAGIKSGSLITARFALEEGRDVYAAPGSVFSSESEGPNQLIKQGARPILGASDLLEGLGLEIEANEEEKPKRDWSGMSEEERSILLNLSSEPTNINDIKRGLQLDISVINSTLTILEIKGIVKTVGGGNYILL